MLKFEKKIKKIVHQFRWDPQAMELLDDVIIQTILYIFKQPSSFELPILERVDGAASVDTTEMEHDDLVMCPPQFLGICNYHAKKNWGSDERSLEVNTFLTNLLRHWVRETTWVDRYTAPKKATRDGLLKNLPEFLQFCEIQEPVVEVVKVDLKPLITEQLKLKNKKMTQKAMNKLLIFLNILLKYMIYECIEMCIDSKKITIMANMLVHLLTRFSTKKDYWAAKYYSVDNPDYWNNLDEQTVKQWRGAVYNNPCKIDQTFQFLEEVIKDSHWCPVYRDDLDKITKKRATMIGHLIDDLKPKGFRKQRYIEYCFEDLLKEIAGLIIKEIPCQEIHKEDLAKYLQGEKLGEMLQEITGGVDILA